MSARTFIHINSLNISLVEFETIIWNQTHIDEIKKRTYMSNILLHNEDVPLQLVKYLNSVMDPIFVIDRWIIDVYDKKKTYDVAMFWLRFFLNEEVSTIFPKLEDDPIFTDNVRRMSAPVYAKLIKSLQNF